METKNNQINVQPPREVNMTEAKQELQHLNTGQIDQTGFAVQKRELLLQQTEKFDLTNKNVFKKLLMSKEGKEVGSIIAESKKQAIQTILTNENKGMRAICEMNAKSVQEVCRTLEIIGRSGLQAGAAVIYTETKSAMLYRLTTLNNEFLDKVEIELENAEGRPEFTQIMALDQVKLMCNEWQKDYRKLMEDFSKILN